MLGSKNRVLKYTVPIFGLVLITTPVMHASNKLEVYTSISTPGEAEEPIKVEEPSPVPTQSQNATAVKPKNLPKTTKTEVYLKSTKADLDTMQNEISTLKKQLANLSEQNTKKENVFDSVPDEHINSIANRLRIIEQLLREHKRAYDYRSHTTKELFEILKALEKEKNKSS